LVRVIAVPGSGGETVGGGADEAGGVPGGDLGENGAGEVAAFVNYPGDGAGVRWWGEETGAEGGVGACASKNVVGGGCGW